MIRIKCRFNDEGEYQQLVNLAAVLGLFPGRIKHKDFFSICEFKKPKNQTTRKDDYNAEDHKD